jgi:uncharacterized protein with von Willebrand factor type A (vWA) domain
VGINWAKAPKGSEFYGQGLFFKLDKYGDALYWNGLKGWISAETWHRPAECNDYEKRQTAQDWPTTDERISAIAQNGGDGLHYDEQREVEEKKKAVQDLAGKHSSDCLASHPAAPYGNKYDRTIIGKYGSGKCVVDVYRVLYAFPSGCPDIDHAIKKLLAPGKRGAKDELQDLKEAIQSIEARISYLNETGA